MTNEQFFDRLDLRQKFGHENVRMVREYMRRNDFDYEPIATPRLAATALIFLGCSVTRGDLDAIGSGLLTTRTTDKVPYHRAESLLDVFKFILADPLNAVTISRIIFDRVNAVVIFELVDGTDQTTPINVPVSPDWQQAPAVSIEQSFLVSLAMDLNADEYIEMGRLVDENDENDKGY